MPKERFNVVKLYKGVYLEEVVFSTVNHSEAKQRAKEESDNLTPQQKDHIQFQVRSAA